MFDPEENRFDKMNNKNYQGRLRQIWTAPYLN